ncbi:MAG TPA: hypothetical protein VJ953_09980 [Saprospiraceae bacterium]|nr:hypothetical protein [Saprospiraceae bacterium]
MKNTLLLFLLTYSLLALGQPSKDIISSIPFRNIGPAFMTGRISDVAKDPRNPSTWYVATASGNVWKTQNNGTTWQAIFDHYGSFSTACITIDPNRPQTLWLGTGENQSQRSVSWGDGVYKSLDGGKSWKNVGLPRSEHIGKILVDPRNSEVVYVAAQGPLWADGGDRGLYKTTDGGQSWERVLHVSEQTGISDLAFDPKNPDVLYAASYQRRRHVGILIAGGEESRIYKSTDGGESWKMLKKGLPGGELGRIAIAVSPQKSNVVYALIAGSNDRQNGFYRSDDFGESWTKKNDYIVIDPQYYGEIYADPNRFDHVYCVDVIIHYTTDGGDSFERLNSRFKHVDNHAIVFDPNDPDYLMVGCDGGVYESWDRGEHWRYHDNLPITQFYRVGLDNAEPFYNVFGGTQDNSTIFGPSQTLSRQGITNADWTLALGGDGFQARIDPEDPNTVYAESQYAGIVRYDKRTGSRIGIQPQPSPDEAPLRWHWDAPLILSNHNAKRLYFAAQRLFRSDDRGDSWTAISEDLSRGEDRNQREVMGKVWSPEAVWKNVYTSPYGTIVALSESPLDEQLLVAGTDDGLIQITEDGGQSWRRMDRFPGVPEKAYVADVFASQHNRNLIYAVFNNHKEGDFQPYFLKSEDLGRNWQAINQGFQKDHTGWSIIEDHESSNLLFAATEFGLYASIDGGAQWTQMKGGLPTIAFRDLEIQKREDDLVAASFGRGMYILDDYHVLRELSQAAEGTTSLFSISEALQFPINGGKGGSRKGSFGDSYYTADNPPYGAAFDLYLAASFQTQKARRKSEAPNSYPDFEQLRAEDFEEGPELFLRISDAEGSFVARERVANRNGYQRVHWGLNTSIKSQDDPSQEIRLSKVPEGNYQAQLFVLQNGELQALTEAQEFTVRDLDLTPEAPAPDWTAFYHAVAQVQMEANDLGEQMEESLKELAKTKDHLLETGETDMEQLNALKEKRQALLALQYRLNGDQSKEERFEYALPGIRDRLRRVYRAQWSSKQITQTSRDNFELAQRLLREVEAVYQSLEK